MRFVVVACLLLLAVFRVSAQPQLINGVAVIVNDAIITYKDVFNRMAEELDFLERRYRTNPAELARRKAELERERIEELVERELILHEFKNRKYPLPESFIESRIAEDIREHGNRATLTKTLHQQGLTIETYRQKVRERIIIEAMYFNNVPRDPVISPFKIEQYYATNRETFKVEDQVKLRMIVLTNRPNDTAFSPRKMGDELLAKLHEGAPFAEMARIYSQGSQANDGGDWGWVAKSVLRQDLSEKAFSLKPGERVLVDSKEGVYIMQIDEAKPAHIKSLAEVRDEIESTLKAQETRRLRKRWIESLKTKSFVRYFSAGTGAQ